MVRHVAENDAHGLKRNEMTRLVNEENRWRAQRFDPVPGETYYIPLP